MILLRVNTLHMFIKRISLFVLSLCFLTLGSPETSGQSMGVRAGLNYSQFLGPKEAGEKFSIASGFHFGFNYGYNFTNKFTLRAELVYSQIGSKIDYDGSGYY